MFLLTRMVYAVDDEKLNRALEDDLRRVKKCTKCKNIKKGCYRQPRSSEENGNSIDYTRRWVIAPYIWLLL